jgi:hypothetical protein
MEQHRANQSSGRPTPPVKSREPAGKSQRQKCDSGNARDDQPNGGIWLRPEQERAYN